MLPAATHYISRGSVIVVYNIGLFSLHDFLSYVKHVQCIVLKWYIFDQLLILRVHIELNFIQFYLCDVYKRWSKRYAKYVAHSVIKKNVV